MNLSYWEYKTWLNHIDYTVVGSGIIGLNCALRLRERFPHAKIVVLERGILPQGASTKNAGFACFGSISEILADLRTHSEEEVLQLVQKRWEGIRLLRRNLGDRQIDYQNHGGHEVFLSEHWELYDHCLDGMGTVNQLLEPVFRSPGFMVGPNAYRFKGVQEKVITCPFEGQIDTGKMMDTLLQQVQRAGIQIFNAVSVGSYVETGSGIVLHTDQFELRTQKLFIATNGFASQLIQEEVRPARAQVLITKPIAGLAIRGTFHLEEGYYYFRNIDDRILLGGGRNLDLKGEETADFGETPLIQNRLETILGTVILPDTPFEIDFRWSGIMGVGPQKRPILRQISDRVYCGVRMGGMGIAIGTVVGKDLADLLP